MQFASRKFALVVLTALALGASGCGSNNKGKIEGKWKIVSMPGEANALVGDDKAFIYFEFLADGTVNLGLGSADPKEQPLVFVSGKYKLLNGDDVEFSGMSSEKKKGGMFGKSDKDRLKIKITGDEMTITGSDGTGKRVRVM